MLCEHDDACMGVARKLLRTSQWWLMYRLTLPTSPPSTMYSTSPWSLHVRMMQQWAKTSRGKYNLTSCMRCERSAGQHALQMLWGLGARLAAHAILPECSTTAKTGAHGSSASSPR